jgi:protein-tyrosine phosphatase
VSDYEFVTTRLATGAALQGPDDVVAMASAGITHVVDCRAEFDDTALFADHPNISVLWDGTQDDGTPKPGSWFEKGIKFALSALAMPDHKVYVHCAAGINRGPSMTYAIMLALGWKGDDAVAAIRGVRPQVGIRYKSDADAAVMGLGYG